MKRSEMSHDQQQGFYQWLNSEWARCNANTVSIENHVVTYLVGTNGGGVTVVAAFAGAANYTSWFVTAALGAFLIGLLTVGMGLALGHRRMAGITRALGADHRLFNKNEIDTVALENQHHDRFKSVSVGAMLAWMSFVAFWVGACVSVYTFHEYMTLKAAQTVSAPMKSPS